MALQSGAITAEISGALMPKSDTGAVCKKKYSVQPGFERKCRHLDRLSYPKAAVQLCIVHMVRNSLNFVPWKVQKEVAADLKLIYTASTVELAEQMLTEFEKKWDKDYQSIGLSWRKNWARIIPFFDYPPEIRKVIYTTNAIESINMSLRKVIKTRSSFPTDEAVTKLFYLALRNISKKWTMPIRDWKAALNRFSIHFAERISSS